MIFDIIFSDSVKDTGLAEILLDHLPEDREKVFC